MIVGEAMCGKSTVIHTLRDSITYLREEKKSEDERYQIVHDMRFNPKSITMGE